MHRTCLSFHPRRRPGAVGECGAHARDVFRRFGFSQMRYYFEYTHFDAAMKASIAQWLDREPSMRHTRGSNPSQVVSFLFCPFCSVLFCFFLFPTLILLFALLSLLRPSLIRLLALFLLLRSLLFLFLFLCPYKFSFFLCSYKRTLALSQLPTL